MTDPLTAAELAAMRARIIGGNYSHRMISEDAIRCLDEIGRLREGLEAIASGHDPSYIRTMPQEIALRYLEGKLKRIAAFQHCAGASTEEATIAQHALEPYKEPKP